MAEDVKYLAVTARQAHLIMDNFRVTIQAEQPTIWQRESRALGLQAAALVLEFEAMAAVEEAERLHTIDRATAAEAQHDARRGPEHAVQSDGAPGAQDAA